MNVGKNAVKLSKIEIAKLLKTLRAIFPEETYQNIKNYLIEVCIDSNEESINSAINGLSEEDEFALISFLMGTTINLVPLEQRPIIKGEYIVPDFLASFQINKGVIQSQYPQYLKCFIDVKSTDKDKYKIGGSELKRRRNFAKQFDLPLLFAVRFTKFPRFPFWVLMEDNDYSKSSLTISFTDIMNGSREKIWNDYWFSLTTNKILFRAEFTQDDSILKCDKYGNLQRFEIVVNGRTIPFTDMSKVTMLYILFEQLTEEIGLIEQGNSIIQTLVPSFNLRSISDVLYRFNQLGRDNRNFPSPAPKILLHADQIGKNFTIKREFLEAIIQQLIKAKILKLFVPSNSFHISKVEYQDWQEIVVNI
ncbi:MAG: hypothetical protein RLZZ203_1725 [Cyanobacteriota bacterium]|jgi:hypothetical protein|uniref:hypothetical protein n=1 Tax=Cuspidothrix issatschenkoi TaxID=230752 RepID=UPI00187E4AF4|nr:hypothetical protein [Cuspidothrix issatschenkoi]MBE9233778.1 hypothetical protein [Cuspidothrix issatschenkoi LEGE 03284]